MKLEKNYAQYNNEGDLISLNLLTCYIITYD